jgi:membrane protein DedA with SNARE-associated domain
MERNPRYFYKYMILLIFYFREPARPMQVAGMRQRQAARYRGLIGRGKVHDAAADCCRNRSRVRVATSVADRRDFHLDRSSSVQHLQSLLAQHGILLVFGNVLLAQLGLPVPAVPLLIVAGALVANGQLSLAAILGATLAASLLGDLPWYFAGRRYGYRVLHRLCRIAIEPDTCVKQTETLFERWGAPSLLVAKYLPGFATVAPPLAGAMGLRLPHFLAFSAVGAVLWACAPLALGMIFSAQVEQALAWIERMGARSMTLAVTVVAGYIAIKWVQRQLLIRHLRTVRVNVHELRRLIGAGAPLVVLDARSQTARKLDPRHIPGAIAVNFDEAQTALKSGLHDHDIVVYCS